MKDSDFLLGTPFVLLLGWLVRRFLDTPTRLPALDKKLARLWIPGAGLWLGALLLDISVGPSTDWLDDCFVLVGLAAIVWVAWQLRAYPPARTLGWAAGPMALLLLVDIGLQVVAPKLLKEYDDTSSTLYFCAFCWGFGLVLVARSQKKRLAAEAERQAEEAAAQQLIVAKNLELEQIVQVRTAALRQQTTALQKALDDLQSTQTQLIQSEKMASLGELTAGIAHEIQNPLNFVNNFAEVSSELATELAEARAYPTRDATLEAELLQDLKQNMQKITQHGRRAASIVRGMLEHSRASTGERVLTDLNALADEYLRLAYHGLRAKDKSFNATLQTDFAPVLPLVEAVSQDVGRVLLNLFTNAFYAVQQRQQAGESGYVPTVCVYTEKSGNQVVVHVQDNGTGMSEAVQQKIFQPFFTTKPTGEGTGLGLSLAHDIITQGHGGTLTVSSQAGVGTEFTICLPFE
jgi:two-component system NtrC family sensor kinase